MDRCRHSGLLKHRTWRRLDVGRHPYRVITHDAKLIFASGQSLPYFR